MLVQVLREFDVDPIPVHLTHPTRGRLPQNNERVSGLHSEKITIRIVRAAMPHRGRPSVSPFEIATPRLLTSSAGWKAGSLFLWSYSFAWNNAISSSPKPPLVFGLKEKRYDSL